MARRGFLAELQHQARVAAREQQRAQKAAARERAAAIRQAEQAQKAAERARIKLEKAAEAERKQLEKEQRAAHLEAMKAKVEQKNTELADIYEEIDSLLAATLEVDDFVDLNSLRREVEHPPFDRTDLETPIPPPAEIPEPPKPLLDLPEPPKGIKALVGKKKHDALVAAAELEHQQALETWEAEVQELPARRQFVQDEHAQAESQRTEALEKERARYAEECRAREAEVADHNQAIDQLIANLDYGTPDAVQEYVSIVLSNSVYPDHFPVEHEFSFDPSTAELRLRVTIPSPDQIPTVKAYKYTKSSDEISATQLTQKACKERYASAVHQVALRTLHEVFEADRRGLIRTIALQLSTTTVDPATGNTTEFLFVAVGAERDVVMAFDLSAVVPSATLDHLGAAVSKDPYNLVAVDASGIRTS